MEETLGKRIVANRRRLGITQDRLAEQLGVTAQAVSKWENDQSCPDITMLPKLAEIFGISVDCLLGLSEPEKVREAELVEPAQNRESEESGGSKSQWEFHWDAGRKPRIFFALWVLLMGGMMLYSLLANRHFTLWEMAWPSALMLFGISGLYPNFSFFRLGCSLFGLYSLFENLQITSLGFSGDLLMIAAVMLFGLSLLVDAFRKPEEPRFSFTHNAANKQKCSCTQTEDRFASNVAFSEETHRISLPRLAGGTANVSFGDATVDLSGCKEIASACTVDANCSFGSLTLRIPSRFRVELKHSTSFASVDQKGHPDPEPEGTVFLDAKASFGEITVIYI